MSHDNGKRKEINDLHYKLISDFEKTRLKIDESWELSNDMVEPTYQWAKGININILIKQYNLFEGTFTKDMLKLANIVEEVVSVATYLEKGDLIEKASNLENLIIKDVINIESLYVK